MKIKSELMSQPLFFREPQFKHYKQLLKCIYGDTPDPETFVETLIDIAANLTDKDKAFFSELNLLDFFLFIIDIRITIVGPKCSIIVKQLEKEITVELDLFKFKEDFISFFKPIYNKKISTDKKIELEFECPSFKRLLNLTETDEDYLLFLKSVLIHNENNTIHGKIESKEQAREIFNKLLPSLSIQLIEEYQLFLRNCSELNLLSRYPLKEKQVLSFIPSIEMVIWLTKIFFNEQLTTIYDNLFYLAHYGHMDLNYIENCTVGEYFYFVNMLKNTLNSKTQSPVENTNSIENVEDVDF